MRVGRALDWMVDAALPAVVLAVLAVGWLATVVVLFLAAPWWAGVAGIAAGVPFLIAVADAVEDGV